MRHSRSLIIFVLTLIVTITITAVELRYLRATSVDFSTKMVLFGVMTFNVVSIITLIFFTARNIYKLAYERKRNIPGHRFKTKLALLFIVFALIPSILLFITASGLATNFINKIFAPHMGEHLTLSMDMARGFYDLMKEQVLLAAEEASKNPKAIKHPNLKISKAGWTDDMPDIVREALSGRKGVEVVTTPGGDIIRAAVPSEYSKRYAVVAEYYVPSSLALRAERLREYNEEYLKTLSYKEPVKINYMLILGFVTLMIVFAGLWFSLKISASITIPIKHLVIATELVKAGDFQARVDVKSDDELGLLIESFNTMVAKLKSNKESLETSYRESDRRRLYLENILEKIGSGVIFLDYDGTIRTLNRAAVSMLRLGTDVTGMHYKELIEKLNSEDLTNMVKGIQGKRYRSLHRQVKVHIEGSPAIVNVFISDIIDASTNSAIGILVVFDDLTELIKAQKALAWQEVARRIAHEIKNPLTPIKLSSERLLKKWRQREDDFDSIFERSVRTIINEVESLRRLVDEFSKYGRMPEITKTKTDLKELIEGIISLYKGFRDVQVVCSLEPLPDVSLDREQFRRAIINIIDNAIKAMNNAGILGISLRLIDNKAVIEVSDTGVGIKETDRERLFMPYFTGVRGGTGLGLAIADKIVTDHGGKISVRNNPSGGSIFTIELPVEEEP